MPLCRKSHLLDDSFHVTYDKIVGIGIPIQDHDMFPFDTNVRTSFATDHNQEWDSGRVGPGTQATIVCKAGFKWPTDSSHTVECRQGGSWSEVPSSCHKITGKKLAESGSLPLRLCIFSGSG